MNPGSFKNQGPIRALVTGGSRGLGKAIVNSLKEIHYDVFAPSRDELDLASSASVKTFCEKYRTVGFDVLVNNAGINFPKSLEESSDERWQEILQVNLTAPRELIKALLPGMCKRSFGRIVNISSVFAIVSKAKRSSYSAAKAGLDGLTRATALEFGESGVLINSVCPGFIDTELTRQNNTPQEIEKIRDLIPLRRLAMPQEVASFVAFLCSERNTYITGQSLVIDGGFTIS